MYGFRSFKNISEVLKKYQEGISGIFKKFRDFSIFRITVIFWKFMDFLKEFSEVLRSFRYLQS
jgi:hypothetical protein